MALDIMREGIEMEQVVGETTAQALVEGEALVPGAGRDEVQVLMTDATMAVGSVEVQNDRVALDGTVNCQVMYRVGEDPMVRTLSSQAPLSYVAEMPGVGPRMSPSVQGVVEHAEASYENGRLMLRVVVGLHIRVLALVQVELIRGFEGVQGIEMRTQDVVSLKTSADATLNVLKREEFELPQTLGASEVLLCRAVPGVSGVAPDMGGVMVSGVIAFEALMASEVPGRPIAAIRHTIPYQQLVEMPDWLLGDVRAQAQVRGINANLLSDQTGSLLRCDIELDIGVQALTQDITAPVVDAYATQGSGLNITQTPLTFLTAVEERQQLDTVKLPVELPEGMPGVATVLSALARPVLGDIPGEEGHLEGILDVSILYLPTGSELPVTAHQELPFKIPCEGCAEGAWVHTVALEADAAPVTADRLELTCQLRTDIQTRKNTQVVLATEAEETPPVARQKGILLVYSQSDDDLWALGKRYGMSVAEMGQLNPDAQGSGKPLLIYRK